MKSTFLLRTLAPLALLAGSMTASAVEEQVGDFRIGSGTYSGRFHYFDLGFSETTRGVTGAPVQLPSVFSGTTQNPGKVGDPATDLGVRTYSAVTHLKNINRYGSDPDGPGGPEPGPQRVGVFQYAIDLTPVETYLNSTSETLTALDLRLELDISDIGREYDLYLSYTEAGEGITLTPVSTDDPAANYDIFWLPSQSGMVDEVINGTHKIITLKQKGALSQTTSLLDLYNAGVRQVNLILMSGAFMSSRTIFVNDLSGIWVNTNVLAADTQVGDFRLNSFGGSFTHVDRLDPVETQPVIGAPLDVPSLLSGTSQNQGGNLVAESMNLFNIDGIEGNAGCTVDNFGGKVVGYGVAGIGTTAADSFQFTAFERSGDFDVNVSLDSITTNVPSGARVGLMVRSSDAADAAHVFIGVRQDGAPVVVIRDADAATATETLEAVGTFPKTLRIKRTGDLFEFFFSKNATTPAIDPDATVVMSDPVWIGFASTSGDDIDSADAVFSDCSVHLADPNTDIGLQTYSTATTIRTLNRYGSSTNVGVAQWAIDLSPLDDYLANNSLNLELLELRLFGDVSPNGEGSPLDIYLSYTNPAESISLVGIEPNLARNTSLSELNYDNLFFWADGALEDEIVNDTHKVIRAAGTGDISLTRDLLGLYNAGVRDLNLIVTTAVFFSGRTIAIGAEPGSGVVSGIYIETSGGASGVVITDVSEAGGVISVTVNGLTNGNTYHLAGSTTLPGLSSLAGTDIVATGTGDVLSYDTGGAPAYFVQVMDGAAP